MGMAPIDVVLSLIPSLNEKEKKLVRDALGTGAAPYVRPCAKNGHKYKQVSTIKGTWFGADKKVMCCERCGDTLTV